MERTFRSVIHSIEDILGERCVDFITAADGQIAFKEYRRDVEVGHWTLIADFSYRSFSRKEDALASALEAVPWLAEVRLKHQTLADARRVPRSARLSQNNTSEVATVTDGTSSNRKT